MADGSGGVSQEGTIHSLSEMRIGGNCDWVFRTQSSSSIVSICVAGTAMPSAVQASVRSCRASGADAAITLSRSRGQGAEYSPGSSNIGCSSGVPASASSAVTDNAPASSSASDRRSPISPSISKTSAAWVMIGASRRFASRTRDRPAIPRGPSCCPRACVPGSEWIRPRGARGCPTTVPGAAGCWS